MLLIGIDVGGTYIKFGLIEDGKIIRSMDLLTNAFDVVKQISNGARELVQSEGRSFDDVEGIGIGFPGIVVDSVVLESPNLGLQNCKLQEILSDDLGKPVVVKNDAEMATLAEHSMGAGENCRDMVLITLGTGVGGGIIAGGRLYEGKGGAGELGHITMVPNGKDCTCGRKGCAEQYISMRALDKLAKDIMGGYPNTCVSLSGDGFVNASELMRAYKKNDACAKEVVSKYIDLVTPYILNICNMFRPEKIVVGGGITHAPELIAMIAKACADAEYGMKNSPKVDIVSATLGNKAGILGTIVCFNGDNDQYLSTTQSVLDEYDEYMERQALDNDDNKPVDSDMISEDASVSEDYNDTDVLRENVDLLSDLVNASKEDDEEPVYDEALLNRVNEMLKKKD